MVFIRELQIFQFHGLGWPVESFYRLYITEFVLGVSLENFDRRLDVVELADWLRALGVNPQAFTNEFEWFADGADENT